MKSPTAKATIWSLLDTYAGFALKFVFAIWITRLLSPHDYGLIAYTGLFLGIATWLSEGGFGTALIQKKAATQIDFSTGYIFNVVLSIFFFGIYYFSAPFIARFFNEPELIKVMRFTSLNLIINALCYIHLIKLIKGIKFKQQTVVNLLSSVASGVIGLTMALTGYGYWALIFQTLIGSLFRMVGFWVAVKWIPSFIFSWSSFKEQFRFGSKIFVPGLLESIFREIHSLVIGKTYSTAQLGNYSRGQKFYDLLIVQTGIAFNKVLYPTLARESDNLHAHKSIYFKTYNLLFFLMAPLSFFMILFSEPFVRILLTEKWIAAAPYMQLYFFAGFIFLLVYFNSTTVLSSNRPRLYLILDIFQKTLFAIALVITYQISISAIIIGWVIAYYVYYITYEIVMYRLRYFDKKKFKEMIHVLFGLLPMGVVYLITLQFITGPSLLFVNIVTQPLVYISTMRLLKFSVYKDFTVLAFPFLPKYFTKRKHEN